MSRKFSRSFKAASFGIGLALVAATSACGSGGGESDEETLVFVNAQPEGTFDSAIASFEKANPDINIEEQKVPFDDLNSTVLARVGEKDTSIDLIHVDEPRIASLASRGLLMDLSSLQSDAEAAVPQTALDVTTYDGKLYALPQWTSSQLLYYNIDLLTKAGLPAPSADPASPMTWEDVVSQGASAQAAGAKYGFTFDQVDRYYQLQPLAEGLDGGSGLKGDANLEPDLTNAGWTKALEWYGSTFESGVSPRGISAEQTPDLFNTGQVAFFAGGPWNASNFTDVNYGVAPFPKFADGAEKTSTDSWSVGVSPFTEHAEASKKFASYITLDKAGAVESSERGNIPVQNDAFSAYQDYLNTQSPEQGESIGSILTNNLATNTVSRPKSIGYVDFETTMNSMFSDIRNGSDPAQSAKTATDELTRSLGKYK